MSTHTTVTQVGEQVTITAGKHARRIGTVTAITGRYATVEVRGTEVRALVTNTENAMAAFARAQAVQAEREARLGVPSSPCHSCGASTPIRQLSRSWRYCPKCVEAIAATGEACY